MKTDGWATHDAWSFFIACRSNTGFHNLQHTKNFGRNYIPMSFLPKFLFLLLFAGYVAYTVEDDGGSVGEDINII